MAERKKQTAQPFLSLGTFLGTVIGVGMFGLPYVASKTGFFPVVLVFIVITIMAIVLYLRFADVVLRTKQRDRIPGYIRRYLGPRWGRVSIGISLVSICGALLAYLIVGGGFIRLALSPFTNLDPLWGTIIFFLLGTVVILRGTRGVSVTDFLLMLLLLVLLLVFLFAALPHVSPPNLAVLGWKALPMAYGIILFALWGLDIVPETAELVRNNKALIRSVLITGLAAASYIYILFIFTVLGVNGGSTTTDALTGFLGTIGTWLTIPAALVGFSAVFTSYISIGLTIRQTLMIDLHMPRTMALLVVGVVPLLLYFVGLKNYITIIGTIGAVLLGAEAALVLAMAEVLHRRTMRSASTRWTTVVLYGLLSCGVLAEAWSVFSPKV